MLETLVAVVGLTAGDRDAALVGESGLVLAGASAYHDPACPLVQDPRLRTTTPGHAAESGLAPCRTCSPEVPAVQVPG